jgi:hypothetical protein
MQDKHYAKQYYEAVGIAAWYLPIHENFLRRIFGHPYANKKGSDYFDTILETYF